MARSPAQVDFDLREFNRPPKAYTAASGKEMRQLVVEKSFQMDGGLGNGGR